MKKGRRPEKRSIQRAFAEAQFETLDSHIVRTLTNVLAGLYHQLKRVNSFDFLFAKPYFPFFHRGRHRISGSESIAIVEINCSQFLEPNSELPTDVVFKVEERSEEKEEEVLTGKAVAHKLLLAAVCPVFRRHFFGDLKEETEEVVIKDTTIEAFNTLIKFIYMEPEVEFRLELELEPEQGGCCQSSLSSCSLGSPSPSPF